MSSRMATEITEQPAALKATQRVVRPLHGELRDLARGTDRVVLFARGSSDSAATYGRYLLEVTAGIPAAMGAPSVATVYKSSLDLRTTLAVVCSQSGYTSELVEVAGWARRCGARVIAVTNDELSPWAAATDLCLVTQAGEETAVPATKSHSTCLLALAELALALTPPTRPGRQQLLDAVDRVPDEVQRLLSSQPSTEALAEKLQSATAFCVAGRGFTYTTALELALKIEETTGVPCIGMSQADLQHGPIAVLGPTHPLILAAADHGPTIPGLVALAVAARSRGAEVVLLGGNSAFEEAVSDTLIGPRLPEPIAPLALIVPGQLFAESLSRRLGYDPDQPVGLSKVTQTT